MEERKGLGPNEAKASLGTSGLGPLGLDVETIRRVMGVTLSGPGPQELSLRTRLALLP